MSNITSTIRPLAQVEAATTPFIYNVSAAVAGTEYSQALPAGTKKFMIESRDTARIQYAYTSGDTGTNFVTVQSGTFREVNDLNFTGTLYFQTNKNSMTVVIEAWT